MLRSYLILLLLVIASCTKNADDVIKLDPASRQSLHAAIMAAADTANRLSHNSIEHKSLIYTLNDYSFYVSRYVRNSEAFLYIEHGHSNIRGHIEKRYYLKGRQVILSIQNTYDSKNAIPYKTVRTFYKNGVILYSEQKSAKTKNELASASFSTSKMPYVRIDADMKKLNDAIYQRGNFDLVLEGITEYPKARYLVLGGNKFNSYRAALLIEKDDGLIKSILSTPEKYRGRKLDVQWDFKGQKEAIYVSGHLAD